MTAQPQPGWSDRVGLCSVTLRASTPAAVLEVAARAGLRRVEWGADVHARPDDTDSLRRLAGATSEAGLTVSSYGTYWEAGVGTPDELRALVSGAQDLAAPRLRLWATRVGAADATADDWSRAVRSLREACTVAADHDVTLALEFHPRTLTDSVDSTLRLLADVDRPELRTYWQPRLDEPVGAAVDGLARLVDHLAAVHVFSWWPGAHRLPLAQRADLWRAALRLLVTESPPCDLLLEFVPDDDASVVAREAATLTAWVTEATAGH